ncbi:hypothetical protein [Stenotrophomonas maltophilia]|uniref:hypothetical protein n=1 Tax=Stenotrophomonas maltophilia TaxID=40324 RepID=UPI000F65C4AC|nr:hypothetical protein [Stenotrophomonas maltophilia]RRU70826.1 hypothetical protein EGJ89_12875 [Stenotrophomonas maltophilia]
MIAAEVLVPCMSFSPFCRLDWAAIAAMGGWAAAIVTFFAVLLPFRQFRRELELREAADLTDADIALRGSLLSLTSIHTALQGIRMSFSQAQGFDDFTDSLDLVTRYVVSSPLPVLPRAHSLRSVRISIASLDACLGTLKSYVPAHEEGLFDATTIEQYVITFELCCFYFDEVVKNVDQAIPTFKIGKQLVPLQD